ncbi:hypothetical protein LCGC14_1030870, partial [marine sediment metagenome]
EEEEDEDFELEEDEVTDDSDEDEEDIPPSYQIFKYGLFPSDPSLSVMVSR